MLKGIMGQKCEPDVLTVNQREDSQAKQITSNHAILLA